MAPEEPRRRKRGQIRLGLLEVEADLQEGYEDVRVCGEERVRDQGRVGAWVRVRVVGFAVEDGEGEGFEPGGAALGRGDEEDVGVTCVEVVLAVEDALHVAGDNPETLEEVEAGGEPAGFGGEGGYELHAFLGLG